MTEEQLTDVILKALSEIAPGVDTEHLHPDIEFRDQFDFDSVDFLNFATALHKAFKIDIPESDCPRLGTLNGCIEYIKERVSPADSVDLQSSA